MSSVHTSIIIFSFCNDQFCIFRVDYLMEAFMHHLEMLPTHPRCGTIKAGVQTPVYKTVNEWGELSSTCRLLAFSVLSVPVTHNSYNLMRAVLGR